MITMPEDVLQADEGVVGFAWDGTSAHPIYADQQVPNKETTMDWAEHQRIVFQAGQLLKSWTPAQHTGNGKEAFRALKDAYDGSNKDRSVLRVSKGIHQPEANPHLQVRVSVTFYANGKPQPPVNYTFHLNVSAVEITNVEGLDSRFQWKGVQFSYEDANYWYRWPAVAVQAGKNSSKARRSSISSASLTEHLNELAEAEKKRLREEEAEKQKLKAQTLEDSILADLQRLEKDEGMYLRVIPNKEPTPKFYKGTGKAYVTDKWKKKGYFVQWNAQLKKLEKVV